METASAVFDTKAYWVLYEHGVVLNGYVGSANLSRSALGLGGEGALRNDKTGMMMMSPDLAIVGEEASGQILAQRTEELQAILTSYEQRRKLIDSEVVNAIRDGVGSRILNCWNAWATKPKEFANMPVTRCRQDIGGGPLATQKNVIGVKRKEQFRGWRVQKPKGKKKMQVLPWWSTTVGPPSLLREIRLNDACIINSTTPLTDQPIRVPTMFPVEEIILVLCAILLPL